MSVKPSSSEVLLELVRVATYQDKVKWVESLQTPGEYTLKFMYKAPHAVFDVGFHLKVTKFPTERVVYSRGLWHQTPRTWLPFPDVVRSHETELIEVVKAKTLNFDDEIEYLNTLFKS